MEEYDVDINFHFIKWDNGQIQVTSDVDDDFEYLEAYERTCIIVNIMKDLFKQIHNNIDEYEIGSEEFKTNIKFGLDTRDSIIKAALNLCYNTYAAKMEEEPFVLEYGLAIYRSMLDKRTKEKVNIISSTTYSDEMNILEPMNGAFAFMIDTAECLADNGLPKPIIKNIMKTMQAQQYKCFEEYIDNYGKNED